jgi:integrase
MGKTPKFDAALASENASKSKRIVTYLYFHGKQYWYIRAYPRRLWDKLGKRQFHRALPAKNLTEAKDAMTGAYLDFKREIDKADGVASADEFELMRAHRVKRPDEATEFHLDAELLSRIPDHQQRLRIIRAAAGRQTPLKLFLKPWLKHRAESGRPFSPKTVEAHEHGLRLLETFMGSSAYLEQLDHDMAADFRSHLVGSGLSPASVNKALTSCRTYLGHLINTRKISGPNPFDKLSVAKGHDGNEPDQRSYTLDEIKKLLHHPGADPLLLDIFQVALMSGARRSEIMAFTAADYTDGCLNVQKSKTPSGRRIIPVSKRLALILDRHVHGKAPGDLIFEWGRKPKGSRAGDSMGKAWTRYRRAAGVDDHDDKRKRSRVNFHSARASFAELAELSGAPATFVTRLLGWRVQGAGQLPRYSKLKGQREYLEQLRAIVEFVSLKLPS